jgi:hypothetical protein
MPLVSTPATNRAHPAEGHLQPGNRRSGHSASVKWQACTPSPPPSSPPPRWCRSELSFSFLSSARAVSPMPDQIPVPSILFLVFCRLCYNYILRRSRKQGHPRVPSGSPDLFLKGNSIGHESTPRQECGPVLVISFLWRRRWRLTSIHLPVEEEFAPARGPAFAPARRLAP